MEKLINKLRSPNCVLAMWALHGSCTFFPSGSAVTFLFEKFVIHKGKYNKPFFHWQLADILFCIKQY